MTTADTLKNIQADVVALGRSLLTLGRLEASAMAKKVGLGAALLVGAALFAVCALALLLTAGALGLGLLLQLALGGDALTGVVALGFVAMALLLLLLAAPLALVGRASIKSNTGVKQTTAEAQATVTAVKSAVERGKADVAVRLEYGEDADQTPARRAQIR